jgi:hypothetical protein
MHAHVITGDAIAAYRQKVLLSALKLECLGMKRNGPSVYSIIKKEYSLKGSKAKVLEQFAAICAG